MKLFKLACIYVLGIMTAVLRYEHLDTLTVNGSYILYFFYSLAFLFISVFVLFYKEKGYAPDSAPGKRMYLCAVFTAVIAEILCYFYLKKFLPDASPERLPVFQQMAAASVLLVLAGGGLKGRPADYIYLGLAVITGGVLFKWGITVYYPFEKAGIMNIFYRICLYFKTAAGDPYSRFYRVGGYTYALSYLPLMWLTYMPAFLAHIDIRWTHILGCFILGILFLIEARRAKNPYKSLIIIIALVILNFSPYLLLRHETEFQVFTVYLGVFIYFWLKDYIFPAAIALALLTSDSLLGILFVPFYFLYLFRRISFEKLCGYGLLYILVAGATICPFLIWSPHDFIRSVFNWYQDIYKWDFAPYARMIKTVGFSLWFFKFGLQRFIQPLQIGLFIGFLAVCAKYSDNRNAIVKLSLFYYLLFIMFNAINWMYMYIPFLAGLTFFILIDKQKQIHT